MGLWKKLRSYADVLSGRGEGGPIETTALQRRRPAILLGTSAFELGQFVSGRVDERLKALAQIKTSALIGCPF